MSAEAEGGLSILCWSQLSLCLLVLYSGSRMKDGGRGRRDGRWGAKVALLCCSLASVAQQETDALRRKGQPCGGLYPVKEGKHTAVGRGQRAGAVTPRSSSARLEARSRGLDFSSYGRAGPTVPSLMVGGQKGQVFMGF